MRTALFNWLWARQHGGKFILRIDDTDHERNMDEALKPILDAFRWLGLDWDEGPEVGGGYGRYYQSQRRSLHDSAIKQLLANGTAYYDFEPPGRIGPSAKTGRSGKASLHKHSNFVEFDSERNCSQTSRGAITRGQVPDFPRSSRLN